MSFHDYVRFMTETFVKHFEKPKNERKAIRIERKTERQPFLTKWFGILPFAVTHWMKRKR
ncbi:YqzE family protein [Bacillus fonticola]|uniref:YqzE family protein n=1 Tax=Bacillus fonticola TaxID=2728853 RepID=UPI0014739A56|nr:YqzE family protein [Bacillus fonticola]